MGETLWSSGYMEVTHIQEVVRSNTRKLIFKFICCKIKLFSEKTKNKQNDRPLKNFFFCNIFFCVNSTNFGAGLRHLDN